MIRVLAAAFQVRYWQMLADASASDRVFALAAGRNRPADGIGTVREPLMDSTP